MVTNVFRCLSVLVVGAGGRWVPEDATVVHVGWMKKARLFSPQHLPDTFSSISSLIILQTYSKPQSI